MHLGSLSSCFSLSYAVNKFVAGVLADTYVCVLCFVYFKSTCAWLMYIFSFTSFTHKVPTP